jgi:hypothetical protein
MNLDRAPQPADLQPRLARLFDLAAAKVADLDRVWDPSRGTPVFTVQGRYTSRGWTEWTQGFQYGMPLLLFEALGDGELLDLARRRVLERMAPHLTHLGVHDHGFNNISTYGSLRRLAREGRFDASEWERHYYDLALKVSGAVQAARWSTILDDSGRRDAGFVHSFNGPHSLFSDTLRSMRSLVLGWQLGHVLMAENDRPVNLLDRAVHHCRTTACYNVYYGQGRDAYDTPDQSGRVVHESIFNMTDGRYRCPSTQQGYSPFSTWTRGLAWVLCGFAEQLEFFSSLTSADLAGVADRQEIIALCRRAAEATAGWYLRHSFADGMVYWDSGAPGIPRDVDIRQIDSDPLAAPEPIDSSAAAIAGQGFWRLSRWLAEEGDAAKAAQYAAASCRIARTLFDEPYLAADPRHQGLILHSVYHRPNGWDHIPPGRSIPCGESSMWGDYHALELALLLHRHNQGLAHVTFFDRPA